MDRFGSLVRRIGFLVALAATTAFAQLSGTYTVGSGGAYASFTAAVSAVTAQGVSGPVMFNVLSGTYNEQIQIGSISGASAVNTVTFQSQSGIPADVTLRYTPTVANNYVVHFLQTDFVTFQNMTLTAYGSTSCGIVVKFDGDANNNRLVNNSINGVSVLGGLSAVSLVVADGDSLDNTLITGNIFTSGSYAIYLNGPGVTARSTGLQITNNTFNNTGFGAVYTRYQSSPQISGNTINPAASAARGIELNYCGGAIQILKNKITLATGAYGIYLLTCDGGTGSPTARGLIANNFITIGGNTTAYGLYASGCTNLDYYHNSVDITSTSLLYGQALRMENGGSGINVVNNILANQGGGYSYVNVGAASIINTSNTNDLYTTGNYIGYWGSADRTTLAAFQAASAKEANSVSVFPHFATASDLHTPSPWLNGMGTAVAAVSGDIDGDVRDGVTPDIGADEFTPDPLTTTPLAGTYTIGSGGTYASFAAAKEDLLLRGISGAVTFDLLNGTYNEQMNLPPVPGADAAKTVTFESQSGNPLSVTVRYAASGAADNYVMRLDGADYIRFRTMTFASSSAAGAPYARVFAIFGGSEDLHIENSILTGTQATGGNTNQALIYADNSLFTSRLVDGNTMNDGTYGMVIDGVGATVLSDGLAITNNTFMNTGYAPVVGHFQNGLRISGNTMTTASTANRGIELGNCDGGLQILKNKIILAANAYGIYLFSCDGGSGVTTPRGLVADNFVSIGGVSLAYGLYVSACTNLDYYYNSVNITSTSASFGQALRIENTGGSGINLVNNILANQGGGYTYFNAGVASIVTASNTNDLYTTGAVLGFWGGANRSNLAAFQTASGKEANSVSLSPGFLSATNLHRLNGSLDSLATPLTAVTDDFDAEPRDAVKPDIGADERITVAVVPSLSINDVTAAEGDIGTTNIEFAVSLSVATTQTVTVAYATANGTAVSPGDYTSTIGSLTFLPGELLKHIDVPIVGDSVNEPAESFVLNLSNPVNATVADGQGIGTITNDDAPPAITLNDISVSEGNAGTINAIFTVVLTQMSSQTVTVDYATADGTATTADNDYTAKSGTLTFTPGTTVQYDTVQVVGDATNEPNETFVVNLSNPSNATIVDNQGLCTIENDDALPAIAATDMSIMEGNAGMTEGVFKVTLSAASSQTITVDFATADGTAMAASDYSAKSGTLTFAPGVTAARESVQVAGDLLNEANETFFLNLTDATNASIADSVAEATIVNDDALPSLTVNDVMVTEGNGSTTPATFVIRLFPASGRDVSVSYATANGTAVAPEDYASATGTVAFAAGETVKTVVVSVMGDTTNESDETFLMSLLSPLNATVGDTEGVCTIINDDVAGANLALTLTDLSDPVESGATVHYRVDVTNGGPDAASGATVRDTLPAGAIYKSSTGTGWTCTESGGVVTCTQTSLAVGAAAPIDVEVTAPSLPGTIRSGAAVFSSTVDKNPGNNADDEVTTILPAGVDLSISNLDSPDPVAGGGPITYSIIVNNAGTATATSVEVRDALPAGMTCPTVSGDGWTCTMTLGVAVCTRASLAPGVSPTITISCTAISGSGSISNTASVSAAEPDPNMLNNTATATTAVTVVSTSVEAIQNLISQVQCLVASGPLSAGTSNALIVKLRAALQAADQAKKLNQLQAFINSVEALVRSGRLPASDGQALIAAANNILAMFAANAFASPDASASIARVSDTTPEAFRLEQNFPNPFNPSTNIRFAVAASGDVSLRIYNALGEEIARLVDGPMPAGTYEVNWTTTGVQSGVYLYRLQTADYVESKKLILLK